MILTLILAGIPIRICPHLSLFTKYLIVVNGLKVRTNQTEWSKIGLKKEKGALALSHCSMYLRIRNPLCDFGREPYARSPLRVAVPKEG